MRKQTITKIVACACVAAMAVGFGACKGADKKTTTTTTTTTVTEEDTTVAEEDTTVAGGTTVATAGGATAPGATGIVKPTDTATAVKLYNDAVAKIGGVTAKVTRELVSGKVAIVDLDTLAPGAKEAFAQNGVALEGAKLVALDPANVASSSVTESGDNYVVSFKLVDANLDSTSAPGASGFMYFLDAKTIKDTIISIGKSIGGENFELGVDDSTITLALNGGTFNVTINKTTGAMSAASLAFTEDVVAKISKPLSATAKVQGKGTVTFAVS